MANILKPTSTIKAQLGIDTNGPVSRFFTQTCAIHMDKYVPYDKGILAMYNIEGNSIIYDQEYATYQYYGMREDGSHVIVNRNTNMHPLATSYWDKHMWDAEGQDITNEVQEYIRRRK